MNEEKLLIEFLKLYLDGLDKVSNYDAVRVGIESYFPKRYSATVRNCRFSLVLNQESKSAPNDYKAWLLAGSFIFTLPYQLNNTGLSPPP